jgi:RNA polymerase sigma factor (sigma-70 family)
VKQWLPRTRRPSRVPGGIGALQGVGWGPEFRVVTRARRPGGVINTMNTQDDAEAIIAAQQLLPAAGQETLKRREASKLVEVSEGLYGKYFELIIHIAAPFAKKARELGDPFNPEEPDRLAPIMQEFVNAGWVGFMKALRKFDPGRGIKLSTYAWKYIRGHCLQLLADYKKSKVYHPVELDAPVDPDDQDAEEAKERAESVWTGDAKESIAQELLRPDEALMRKEEAPFRQRARKKLMADIARSLSPKEEFKDEETTGARRERDTPPSIHHPYGPSARHSASVGSSARPLKKRRIK